MATIGMLVQGRRGNHLVYFPSYQYRHTVLQEFQVCHPTVPVLVERPSMTEPERDAFLAAFSVEHGETRIGFAVLGGTFGEGIDLVGERLNGAVIVGVGLPQLCVERDLIRDHFQQQNAAGFEYAYTFPGMNRVLQAVGRVIRLETVHGVVLLIDARFNEVLSPTVPGLVEILASATRGRVAGSPREFLETILSLAGLFLKRLPRGERTVEQCATANPPRERRW